MRRVLFAAVTAVLGCAVVAAQEPKPAQPKAVPAQPVQPLPIRVAGVTAARMAQLEEEVETLEAHRDVKKAYLRAAEVSAKVNEKLFALMQKAANAASAMDLGEAEAKFETAKAQVDIRAAELKEVEVKIKYAKKRLEDAKATGVRPAPGAVRPEPKAIDP
jgi:hypothetical protein